MNESKQIVHKTVKSGFTQLGVCNLFCFKILVYLEFNFKYVMNILNTIILIFLILL